MEKKHKIAFLFIDDIHHVNHFVTIAIALAKKNDVSILTFPAKHDYLFNKLKELNGGNVKVEQLPTQSFRAFTDKLKKRRLPRNNFWVKKNSYYIFENFDAVVFSGFSHRNLLKAKGKKTKPYFIKTPHGISGRDHGYYEYFSDFDFTLLFGDFDREILEKKNLLKKHSLMGYSKLDALKTVEKPKLFNNDKKTVIYCPHFSPTSTSWNFYGLQILEYFENQDEYNLIFAPHINLFNRKGGEDASLIPEKYFNSGKIVIDLGSIKSVDMQYINAADIYFGDISSQVYEFIITPRPCIFINSEKIEYEKNIHYRFWQCGEVIEDVTALDTALKYAEEKFEKKYREVQKRINAENYYTEAGSTASERATKAIHQFLDDNP